MLPAKFAAEARGLNPEDAAYYAWSIGLFACFGSGIIECAGAFVAERIRQAAPRAALLSTLAGIAIGFISMPFVFKAFAEPLVGLVPLVIIFIAYFARVQFKGGLPGGLLAVLVGTALAWISGVAPGPTPDTAVQFHFPIPVIGPLFSVFADPDILNYASVIIAMGVMNVVGSLQNIDSAEAAGDRFPTQSSLTANGLGTMAAALWQLFPHHHLYWPPRMEGIRARVGAIAF